MKTLILGGILALTMAVSGSGLYIESRGETPRSGSEPSPAKNPGIAVGDPAPGGGGEVSGTPIQYDSVDRLEWPQAVADWVNDPDLVAGSQVITVDGVPYLVIAGAEQPTGGYSIEVSSAVDTGTKVVVTAHLNRPAPDMMVIQAFTRPALVLRLAADPWAVEVVLAE